VCFEMNLLSKANRKAIWKIMQRGNIYGRYVASLLIGIIILNSFLMSLLSFGLIDATYKKPLYIFNLFTGLIFFAEYFLRLWSCVESEDERFQRSIIGRINYATSHNMVIDLGVLVSFILPFTATLAPIYANSSNALRFLKLTRYYPNLIHAILIFLVAVDVVANMLGSIGAIYYQYYKELDQLEMFIVIVFSVEYAVRIVMAHGDDRSLVPSTKSRLKYIFSPHGIIDLLSVLPYYASILYYIEPHTLMSLRLLRVLKITRYSSSMKLLLTVLRQEADRFAAAVFILLVIALLSSGIVFLVEHPYQPDAFSSIPATLYWSIITMTTVGYGDIIPITPLGKIMATVTGISAILITALPAGILASAISDQIRKNRIEYTQKLESLAREGKISDEERNELAKEGEALGLDENEAGRLFESILYSSRATNTCPHCGKPLNMSARRKPVARAARLIR